MSGITVLKGWAEKSSLGILYSIKGTISRNAVHFKTVTDSSYTTNITWRSHGRTTNLHSWYKHNHKQGSLNKAQTSHSKFVIVIFIDFLDLLLKVFLTTINTVKITTFTLEVYLYYYLKFLTVEILFYRSLLVYKYTTTHGTSKYFLCSHLNEWVGTTCTVIEIYPWHIKRKYQDVELYLHYLPTCLLIHRPKIQF